MNDTERAALVAELAKWMRTAPLNRQLTYEDIAEEFIDRHIDRLLAAANTTEDQGTSFYTYTLTQSRRAAEPSIDELLDSVHPEAAASLQFIQPYLTTDPEPYWQAHVSVPTGGLTGFQKHRGTGATRYEAIKAAVASRHAALKAQATATQEGTSE